MRVVYLKVGRQPVVKDIDGSLESMQELVGGYIQSVPLSYNTALVCDEDGRLKGRPVNRVAFTDDGDMIDLIRGDFFRTVHRYVSGCACLRKEVRNASKHE